MREGRGGWQTTQLKGKHHKNETEGCFEEAALLEDESEWLCLVVGACEREMLTKRLIKTW